MSVDIFELAPRHPAEAERERAVQLSGALDVTNDPELLAIVEEARRMFRTSMAAVSIIYRDWQYLIAAAGLPGGPYSRYTSFCGHVVAGQERLMCVPDTHHDPRFAGNPSVMGGLLVRSYAGAQLLGAHTLPLGALCVFDIRPHSGLAVTCGGLVPLADRVMERLERAAASAAAPETAALPTQAGASLAA